MNSYENTVKDIRKNVEGTIDTLGTSANDAAQNAKKGFFETIGQVTRAFNSIRSMDTESVLGQLGLERRRSGVQSVFVFTGGFALGAGTALLLAPTSGSELRAKIAKSITTFLGPDAAQKVETFAANAKDAVEHAKSGAKDAFDSAKTSAKDAFDTAEKTVKSGVSEVQSDVADAKNKTRDHLKGGSLS